MKILFINAVCVSDSPGVIASSKAKEFLNEGHEIMFAYGRDNVVPDWLRPYSYKIGSDLEVNIHGVCTRLFDRHGFCSTKGTEEFLKEAEEFNPDIVWLHNLHGYYINVEKLFKWIKSRPNMRVKWTLHDCWAFTGHCAYFTYAACDKWKTLCKKCPQKNMYPKSFIDNSKSNYERKKELFTGVNDMTIITPSKWLADLVKESYLSEYDVEVVNNTINTDVFKPSPSSFRLDYQLGDKKILLGVASPWSARKGLEHIIKLASMLDDNYVVVLVGLSSEQIKDLPKDFEGIKFIENVGKSSMFSTKHTDVTVDDLPAGQVHFENKNGCAVVQDPRAMRNIIYTNATDKSYSFGANIIAFERTDSAEELAQFYTAADYFVNTTLEENYPTVNLEAIACGTKVITYDTGGSRETLNYMIGNEE